MSSGEKPTHLKARSSVQQGLFDGLSSFRELEMRIAGLPTDKDRGNAFEVFAEAYFATQPAPLAKQVWTFDAIAPSVKQRLGLGRGRDMGVDGVFETRLGEFHAYQVKFRTGRPALTWKELSTFMGLTEQVLQRVLFTNCDDLPRLMNERHGFYCIRGGDLDKLEPRDFVAIVTWLRGAVVERALKSPQPHQQEARDAILPAFETHNRATAIMACGTGKTLVALWVAEQTKSRNVLVLVPSLALLRQTLHEWLRETHWRDFSYLCVCSDPTVDAGTDELIVRQSDLDFPVTTDGTVVRQFLQTETTGVKLVFSTYQSARVVAASLARGFAFDLGIFDEAHKTAGGEGRSFSFALEDKNLSIKKRLFLTATPRHYDVRKRDKEGDAKLVYSMDVPEVYGPVAHTLTFAEAARRAIICNYKVIISVVTSDMVNDHRLRHSKVLVKGVELQARQVANQLAVKAAVDKHGVSKIFTFHRSVASAKSFVAPVAAVYDRRDSEQKTALAERRYSAGSGEGIGNHLPDFCAFHVNGTMPTAERDGLMADFRAAPKAVMSNARCLTEGVDVPAVDMVAFITPKRSRVDIVQATGRAMRLDRGNAAKTTGYILVPLFVEQAKGESVEEAVARAEFDEVWNVLQAMQEQDEVLAEIIRQMREERGRTKGSDDARFRERVEVIGPRLSVSELRESITTSCLDKLGLSWDERYGQLKAFKERFGHCNVSAVWNENPKLGWWVVAQRRAKGRGCMSEDRIRRLDQIGFVWRVRAQAPHAKWDWGEMFGQLLDYARKHGNCELRWLKVENPSLGRWIHQQQIARRQGTLSEVRIRQLDEVGFVWEIQDAAWNEMYAALVEYKKVHADCNVPTDWRRNPELSRWVRSQRASKRRGTLAEHRGARLDEIGFVWDAHEAVWEEMVRALAQYKKSCDDCLVSADRSGNRKLASWIQTQRQHRKCGRLSDERIRTLDQLGFAWNPQDVQWEKMFSALAEYTKIRNSCIVPNDAGHCQLHSWCEAQRKDARKNRITEERIRRLDEVGFVWETEKARWEEMFNSLLQYKAATGHCDVPRDWSNWQMGSWVKSQRNARQRGHLSEERIRRLNAIGFQWEIG